MQESPQQADAHSHLHHQEEQCQNPASVITTKQSVFLLPLHLRHVADTHRPGQLGPRLRARAAGQVLRVVPGDRHCRNNLFDLRPAALFAERSGTRKRDLARIELPVQ